MLKAWTNPAVTQTLWQFFWAYVPLYSAASDFGCCLCTSRPQLAVRIKENLINTAMSLFLYFRDTTLDLYMLNRKISFINAPADHTYHAQFTSTQVIIVNTPTVLISTEHMSMWSISICIYISSIAIVVISSRCMMTSSNENSFRVTGHLCGEFTAHRLISRTKTSDAELRYFGGLNERLNKQSWGWWFDKP